MKKPSFQSLLQKFFLDHLISQQRVSNCTVESYKYTFRILLKYMRDICKIKIEDIEMPMLNRDLVLNFLKHLEYQRNNKCKTINSRLAAIKSFMDFVSYDEPQFLEITRKIKSIPFRKTESKEVNYLSKEEISSLLNSCNHDTPSDLKDYLIILLLYNTGIRVSELIVIKKRDIITTSKHRSFIKILGKGRKQRIVPLWENTSRRLHQYIIDNEINDDEYVLSGRKVDHLTRSGVRYRIECIVEKAKKNCSSLLNKNVSAHVFRHSTAMSLLQSGVDISTIAILLGHESIETTHKYMISDLRLKEEALNKVNEPNQNQKNQKKYTASNSTLEFLNSL